MRKRLYRIKRDWQKLNGLYSAYFSNTTMLRIFLCRKIGFSLKDFRFHSTFYNQNLQIRIHNDIDIKTYINTYFHRFHLPPKNISINADEVIIDLGSNIGLTILDLHKHFPKVKVIGVEMDPSNYAIAKTNTAKNSLLDLYNYAIWKEDGWVTFDPNEREDGYSITTDESQIKSAVKIRSISINTLISDLGIDKIGYLKMDIEGAEKEVFFEGDISWLRRVRNMNIELHDFSASDTDKLICLLKEFNYKIEHSEKHWASIFAFK